MELRIIQRTELSVWREGAKEPAALHFVNLCYKENTDQYLVFKTKIDDPTTVEGAVDYFNEEEEAVDAYFAKLAPPIHA